MRSLLLPLLLALLRGAAAGEDMLRVWDDAIPPRLMAEALAEARVSTSRSTHLIKAGQSPRTPIERVVEQVRQFSFPGAPEEALEYEAEWWVQANIGGLRFHFDKDESLYASGVRPPRAPRNSTITYLTDVGAPTLVLGQRYADVELPPFPEPEEAALVFPRAGRHVVFDSSLFHGVLDLGHFETYRDPDRVTLLVNWWKRAPGAPGTTEVTALEAASWRHAWASLLPHDSPLARTSTPLPVVPTPVTVSASPENSRWVSLLHPNARHHHWRLPTEAAGTGPGAVLHVRWPQGEGLTSNNIVELNLQAWPIMNQFFNEPPHVNVIIFLKGRQRTQYYPLIREAAALLRGKARVYVADPVRAHFAIERLRLSLEDGNSYPLCAVVSTVQDRATQLHPLTLQAVLDAVEERSGV